VSFRHMQVMFTSSAGNLEPSNLCVDASVGGTPLDRDGHEDRNIIGRKVGPGEKITYLYKLVPFSSWVQTTSTKTFGLFFKGCGRPFS